MKQHNVLIVEDEVLIRFYMKSVLHNMGIKTVLESSSGEDAIRLTRENSIDLILMDIRLAGSITGIEAAEEISKEKSISIAFTSSYEYEDRINDRNIPGFIGFYSKPIEEYAIKEIFNKLPN